MTKLLAPAERSCYPARKNSRADYAGGFSNDRVAEVWRLSKSRVSHKWDTFCSALLAVYREIGRQRLAHWIVELGDRAPGIGPRAATTRLTAPDLLLATPSDDELSLIWQRSAGFVRSHKRGPFEHNMLALYQLDTPGFWFLIQELDFDARLSETSDNEASTTRRGAAHPRG